MPKYIYATSLALLADEVEVYLKTSIKLLGNCVARGTCSGRLHSWYSSSVSLAASLMRGMYTIYSWNGDTGSNLGFKNVLWGVKLLSARSRADAPQGFPAKRHLNSEDASRHAGKTLA